jgi:predicted metal-dependent phosphoesterase TrpH
MRAWGSSLVAITDHDTLAGVRELHAAGLGVGRDDGPQVLVGVEINTAIDAEVEAVGGTEERLNELHILGLGVDPDDVDFEAVLERQRGGRERRLRLTLERLDQLGMDVEDDLPEVEGGIESLGRPHVARALVRAGHALDVNDAFAHYLVPGTPGYVRRQGIGPRAAIEAIRAAGGIASLAHSPWAPEEPAVMERLISWGLGGIEVHYHFWSEERVERMATYADEQGLLRTGGSDYHGDSGDYATAQASVHVPATVGERLLDAIASERSR